MGFTLEFMRLFGLDMYYASPLLLLLLLLIAGIGLMIGRREGWTHPDALYYSFITATTVGYGDITPVHNASKFWAVIIALLGMLLTGLVVALGIHAATIAFVDANPQIVASSLNA